MMRITKIQQQAKRPDRYSVYVDGKYLFSLSDYQLVSAGLRTDKEYSQKEFDTLVDESQFGKVYERALNYVMIRPRSRHEIEGYLSRTFLYPKSKVYTNKAGERVIKKIEVDMDRATLLNKRALDRLEQKGYINDESFAKAWIRSRQLTKKLSKRKLEQELRQKRVNDTTIATLLQNYDVTEADNLQAIIDKKKRLTRYNDDNKLTAYLLRQGFNYDDIRTALSQD